MKLVGTLALALWLSSNITAQSSTQESIKMKVAVWDTYVPRKDGRVMHFDIIAPQEIKDTAIIYGYGKAYLKTKGQEEQPLSSKECRFCHVEAIRHDWEMEIKQKGYFIIEMENCQ